MTKVTNLLFICSRNKLRSPTAEKVWNDIPNFNAKSAGTSPAARKVVSPADIRWADYIFVMELKHKNRLMAKFTRLLDYKRVYVLDIPDDYKYMDSTLIKEIRAKVSSYLDTQQNFNESGP